MDITTKVKMWILFWFILVAGVALASLLHIVGIISDTEYGIVFNVALFFGCLVVFIVSVRILIWLARH